MDGYEGNPPFYYYKKNLHITLDNGGGIDGFVYLMHEEDGFQPGFPSLTYYETVKQGYQDFGFDLSILRKALNESTKQFRPFGWITRMTDIGPLGFPMTAEDKLYADEFCASFKKAWDGKED